MKTSWIIGAAFALLPSLAEAGTVAHYRFENGNPAVAVDETGNHNGTISAGASLSSSVGQNPVVQTGAPNTQSLSISGGQSASIPHSSSLSFGNNPWTIEAYINLNSMPTIANPGQYIVQKKGAQADDFQDYAFLISGNRSNLANTYGKTVGNTGSELRVELGLGVAPGIVGITSNLTIPSVGDWIFVSAAYDGGTSLRFTLDDNLSDDLPGQIDTIALPGLNTVTNSGPLNIGVKLNAAGAAAQPFAGLLDEVRISNEVLSTNALLNVPEPSTWALAALGAAAVGFVARRRRQG